MYGAPTRILIASFHGLRKERLGPRTMTTHTQRDKKETLEFLVRVSLLK